MKRILIVDDESLIRYSLSASLQRNDTYIKAVECGKDALSEISHGFFDLVFLDVNLPDSCGLDLMKTIKKASPDTLIIIMTGGVVNEPGQLRSIQANAHLLLPKPFDLDRFKLFVDRILGLGQERSLDPAGDPAGSRAEGGTFENWLIDDKRKRERKAVMPCTTCSVVASDNGQGEKSFTAGIIEMNDTGMCIRTDYLLKPGQILRFSDNHILSTGVVRWSKNGEADDSYRAGIQFVMPEGQPHLALEA